MDKLIRELAANTGDYAVGKWGQHLPKHKQLALWRRHHDCTLSALMAYDDLQRAHRTRALAQASEN